MKRKNQKKAKKISKKACEAVEKKLSSLPTSCTSCGAAFDKNDFSVIDNWKVSIHRDSFQLTCPKCE